MAYFHTITKRAKRVMIILIWVIGENWSKSTVEKDKIGEVICRKGTNSPIFIIREKNQLLKTLRFSIFTQIRLFNFWFWLLFPFSKYNFGQFSLFWHLILTDFRFLNIWFRSILAFSKSKFVQFSLFRHLILTDFGFFDIWFRQILAFSTSEFDQFSFF